MINLISEVNSHVLNELTLKTCVNHNVQRKQEITRKEVIIGRSRRQMFDSPGASTLRSVYGWVIYIMLCRLCLLYNVREIHYIGNAFLMSETLIKNPVCTLNKVNNIEEINLLNSHLRRNLMLKIYNLFLMEAVNSKCGSNQECCRFKN